MGLLKVDIKFGVYIFYFLKNCTKRLSKVTSGLLFEQYHVISHAFLLNHHHEPIHTVITAYQ